MASMTPIKIRGKRRAAPAEKWRSGKNRPVDRRPIPAASLASLGAVSCASIQHAAASARKRKQRDPALSLLEQLPPEIVQEIFELSGNIELPAASLVLKAQLSSRHVYTRLTTRILRKVFGYDENATASPSDLAAATRLLNSRFMTWDFFKAWLDEQAPDMHPREDSNYVATWNDLTPVSSPLTPQKLLHGTWTAEKTSFLAVFVRSTKEPTPDLGRPRPSPGELAVEGAFEAIAQRAPDALDLLFIVGVRPTTEMFRAAVIDNGCDEEMLSILYMGVQRYVEEVLDLNTLDPALWSWAEKARERGDRKGDLLVRDLRRLADQLRESQDHAATPE